MVVRLSRGAASVSELAAPLDMSLPSVMQHLDVLQRSGLVRSEKIGRVRRCRLAARPDAHARGVDRRAPRDLGEALRPSLRRPRRRLLRQSELLGLRWQHVDTRARRVRLRNAWVRYEHSGEGKSDLSTRRAVPMTDRLAAELTRWRLRTSFGDDEDLVFAHPELGVPLDRTKVTRRFQAACIEANVRGMRKRASATRSPPRSRRLACRCARFRSTSGTSTSRRRRSTPTMRRRRARSGDQAAFGRPTQPTGRRRRSPKPEAGLTG